MKIGRRYCTSAPKEKAIVVFYSCTSGKKTFPNCSKHNRGSPRGTACSSMASERGEHLNSSATKQVPAPSQVF